IKIVPDFVYGSKTVKVDDDDDELEKMLIEIDELDKGKMLVSVPDGSGLHRELTRAIEAAGALWHESDDRSALQERTPQTPAARAATAHDGHLRSMWR